MATLYVRNAANTAWIEMGGAQGPQGFQGFQGFQGNDGVQGAQGIDGNQGSQGQVGNQGSQGQQGTGSQGAQGLTGNQGDQGNPGAQGSEGPQGTGSQGPQGLTGNQGDQGNPGAQGLEGPQGTGSQGPQGNQGLLGATGINYRGNYAGGTSYVVNDAVASGGTTYICIANTTGNTPPNATYWNVLALQGTQGSQGNQGNPGFRGDQGSPGSQGQPGQQGSQGNVGNQGNPGFQGDQGQVGSQGQPGQQGSQGNVGNQGNPGFRGDQGPPGSQGQRGLDGAQGAQGLLGSTLATSVHLSPGGAFTGGSYTASYSWPAGGAGGFLLSAFGLLMGNAPANGGVQINASGDYAFIGKVSGNYFEWRQDIGRITLNGVAIVNPSLTLPAFTVTFNAASIYYYNVGQINGTVIGYRTATANGGTGAINYHWSLPERPGPNPAEIWFSASAQNATVYGRANNGSSHATVLTCQATDANGRVTLSTLSVQIVSEFNAGGGGGGGGGIDP